MGVWRQTEGLTDVQQEILSAVHEFVENEIIPQAQHLEHNDEYPTEIVEGMKEMGIFGLMIPRVRRSGRVPAHVRAVRRGDRPRLDECLRDHQHALHRGVHGDAARHRCAEEATLPRMATGELRGSSRCPSPGGSDVAAIQSKAVRDGDEYVLNGQKMADQRWQFDPVRRAGPHRCRSR